MTDSSDDLSDSDFHPATEDREGPGLPRGITDPHTDCASELFSRFSTSGLTRSLSATNLIPHNTTSTDNAWLIDFDHTRDRTLGLQRNDLTKGLVSLKVKEPSAHQKPNVALPADSRRRLTAKTASNDDHRAGDRRELLRERAPTPVARRTRPSAVQV